MNLSGSGSFRVLWSPRPIVPPVSPNRAAMSGLADCPLKEIARISNTLPTSLKTSAPIGNGRVGRRHDGTRFTEVRRHVGDCTPPRRAPASRRPPDVPDTSQISGLDHGSVPSTSGRDAFADAMSDGTHGVVQFDEADDFPRAREVLDAAGYTEEGLREALARADLLDIGLLDAPAALRRIRAETPLHSLICLFFLGVPVPADAVRRAVQPMSLEHWRRAGLLAVEDGMVLPLVKLRPYRGLVLASDLRARMRADTPADFVVDVSKSTALMAHTALRCHARQTLDLGTGCGILALLASAHTEQVWATDKNTRAVAFARFNTRLNGIDNVHCLAGDLFEPVVGRRFDLVISNPPYVISPTARFLF